MAFKSVLFMCAQALLVQCVFGQVAYNTLIPAAPLSAVGNSGVENTIVVNSGANPLGNLGLAANGAANGVGLNTNGVGVATNGAGLTANGVGLAANGVGLAANGVGLAANGVGLAANGAGLAANGVGLAANGAGLAANGVGLTVNGAGLAANGAGLAANGVGFASLGANTGAVLNAANPNYLNVASVSGGGVLPVTSYSPIAPAGLTVLSDNVIEGTLFVSGDLPFLSAVAFEGGLATAGSGAASCGCGDGSVGIVSENAGAGLGLAGLGGINNLGGLRGLGRGGLVL
ncbi:autotransporter adhesin BpaC-like [Plodia interpunctella]|uniref:autotransporter adhesin BpaC-like n=1 Tax=Plodia interpunctella TaxID=58824 RepID=UPI0023685102|nr:autotransporter adhesin BpaC-like [Plodia interpunctella]